jgi:signal transduction histidine kinase
MSFDLFTVIAATGAASYSLLAAIALARSSLRERAARTLVLYTVVSSLWALAQTFWRAGQLTFVSDDIWVRLLFYGVLLLSWLFLHLSRSFLRLEGTGLGWWALGAASVVVVTALDDNLLGLPDVLWVGTGWAIRRGGLTFGALILGWGLSMGGVTLLTANAYRRTQQPLHRNRITYWPLALGLNISGDTLLFSGHETLGGVFRLLGTLIAAYAVLTHRLPDVRQMVQRAVSYTIITLLTAVVYTVGFTTTRNVFLAAGYSPLLAGAVVALVLVILFQPLLNLTQQLANRLISGTGYDPRRALREYSLSISNILDLERLATMAVGIISEAMEIRRGALFLVHHEKKENNKEGQNGYFYLRAVGYMGEDGLHPGVLSVNSPVANCLRREHRPLPQYDIDLLRRFEETPTEERAWFASLGMDVYVPIYAKGEWIGLLALGPKASGNRYFDNDLVLLSTLADQTAVALENARLFDDLKARNVENERLNRELAAANRALSRLDQAKSDFINVASHELRTPLTGVRGYADILGETIGDESLTPDMALRITAGISKAARRLEEIVDSMFDISQIDTETLALDPKPISVAKVVNVTADTWATALNERQQKLTVEGLAVLPAITADSKRLQQVFSHVVQNAIKYTPDGGQICVTGRLLGEGMPPQDQSVEIVVADTGIGIAPDDLERVFDKFYRVGDVLLHSTGKTKFKGAGPGLGLTIVRGIVQAHGGRIWIESPGYDEAACPGSQLYIVLPVQPRHLETASSAAFIAAVRANPEQA